MKHLQRKIIININHIVFIIINLSNVIISNAMDRTLANEQLKELISSKCTTTIFAHKLEELLAKGANPDTQDDEGNTALIRSMTFDFLTRDYTDYADSTKTLSYPNYNIHKILFAHGANPDMQNKSGRTVLMEAVKGEYPRVVRNLIAYGANPNIRNNDGLTALSMAVISSDNGIVHELLNPHDDLFKALQIMRKKETSSYLGLLPTELLTLIHRYMQTRTDPNIVIKDGRTVLMFATQHGDSYITRHLLEQGANPDAQNDDGMTALMLAAQKAEGRYLFQDRRGCIMIIHQLLEHGANPNIKGKMFQNALITAVDLNNNYLVRLLLKNGADPAIESTSGVTALVLAQQRGYSDIIDSLRNPPPLYLLSKKNPDRV